MREMDRIKQTLRLYSGRNVGIDGGTHSSTPEGDVDNTRDKEHIQRTEYRCLV